MESEHKMELENLPTMELITNLEKEINRTKRRINQTRRKTYHLSEKSEIQSEELVKLKQQLTDEEKNEMLFDSITKQEVKLVSLRNAYWKNCMAKAIKIGSLEKVKDSELNGCNSSFYMIAAAEQGHLDIVEFIISKYPLDRVWNKCAIGAARGNQFDILKYAEHNIIGDYSMIIAGKHAAEKGHFDIFDYIVSKGYIDWHNYMKSAIAGGHQEIIEYCEKHNNSL